LIAGNDVMGVIICHSFTLVGRLYYAVFFGELVD
jgi:hypothetical protein